MKILQHIDFRFIVEPKENSYRNEETINALENTDITEDEKIKNEKVARKNNDNRFLRHQKHNHNLIGT
jgi:hypothetical protein